MCVSLTLCLSSDSSVDQGEDDDKERTCDSLLMCIVTVLSHGLRSGGGVGDVLRKPSKEVLCVCVCMTVQRFNRMPVPAGCLGHVS